MVELQGVSQDDLPIKSRARRQSVFEPVEQVAREPRRRHRLARGDRPRLDGIHIDARQIGR